MNPQATAPASRNWRTAPMKTSPAMAAAQARAMASQGALVALTTNVQLSKVRE